MFFLYIICLLKIKNISIPANIAILTTSKDEAMRAWNKIHQQSALIFPDIFTHDFKLRVISEDAHACDRFSNLISNASGVGHLPIFCKYKAFLEHQSILMGASFVVLWCWWPQFAKPDWKQGQLVLMSELELMESFVAHTCVCTILRGAESYHAFGAAQSFTCQVAKILANCRINHEHREVSSLQLTLHCLHVCDDPKSATDPMKVCNTSTFEQLSKAGPMKPQKSHLLVRLPCVRQESHHC